MKTNPLSSQCESLFAKRDHVCFGVSPFNSYFSDQKLKELGMWGLKNFKKLHFFVPDLPSAYTFEALGYSPSDALKKARKQGQYTINKIYKMLESLGMSHSEIVDSILNWEALSANPEYLRVSKTVNQIFDTNPIAREHCLEASRWVLEKRVPDPAQLSTEQLLFAVKYFLSEIPLFTHTADIVGAESSVFCYHQSIDFLVRLYQRELPFEISDRQGFVVAQSETTESVSAHFTDALT